MARTARTPDGERGSAERASRRRAWAALAVAALLLAAYFAARSGAAPTGSVVRVAAASSFVDAQAALAAAFEAETGVRVVSSIGSTGQLYAQIRNGAPYDVFLAADAERPGALERQGLAVEGSRFIYAVGRLALYAPGQPIPTTAEATLRADRFERFAIANPRTAPYGAAAEQVLERVGMRQRLDGRLVLGESVAQAFQFVRSGAVDAGLVSLAQLVNEPPEHYQTVFDTLHAPLAHEAVLLRDAENPAAARAYLRYLREPEARRRISRAGYALPTQVPTESAPESAPESPSESPTDRPTDPPTGPPLDPRTHPRIDSAIDSPGDSPRDPATEPPNMNVELETDTATGGDP